MPTGDWSYFSSLKEEIVVRLRETYPGINESISTWKGQDIVNFQEDLLEKTGGQVSEKWFYTHLKADSGKLPRVDILNMLSHYAGYTDWNDFKYHHKDDQRGKKLKKPSYQKALNLTIIVLCGIIAVMIFIKMYNPMHQYEFCFVDTDRKEPIKNIPVEIEVLNENESPYHTMADTNGCFTMKSKQEKIRFVVRSAYYKTDTITRLIKKRGRSGETIKLKTNDYALMIHYFSTSNLKDWNRRRLQLNKMFTDNAEIYQIYGRGLTGMELYNKEEFIDKLTMPISSLKNIEILEVIYNGEKISMMRFRQNK